MQTEIEAKFLHVDHAAIRAKLRELGAELVQPMRLMKRTNMDFPDGRLGSNGGWVRVRDEGDKVTMSYKQLRDRSLHGTKEVQVTVDEYAATEAFLCAIGLEQQSYQETRRESWQLSGVQIELDAWPWIDPFIEIEGADEHELQRLADMLGFDWEQAVHGSVEIAYQAEYDVTDREIDDIPQITFQAPAPAWLKTRRR